MMTRRRFLFTGREGGDLTFVDQDERPWRVDVETFWEPRVARTIRDAHAYHCCALHGCKYADKRCPVAQTHTARQKTMCEWCWDELYEEGGWEHAHELNAAYDRGRQRERSAESFVTQLLSFFAEYRIHDELHWHVGDDGQLHFTVDCSDVFEWATADSEPITAATLPELQLAVREILQYRDATAEQGVMLYVCRRRGQAPKGFVRSSWVTTQPALWNLFTACERPTVDAREVNS